MKRSVLALSFAGLLSGVSFAQAPSVTTLPAAKTTTNVSSTIAVTNTFQEVWPVRSGRTGCTIQNNGTNAMYVYFGPIASATAAASAKLVAGQALNCSVNGIVLTDQVSITGTSGEAFYAVSQ